VYNTVCTARSKCSRHIPRDAEQPGHMRCVGRLRILIGGHAASLGCLEAGKGGGLLRSRAIRKKQELKTERGYSDDVMGGQTGILLRALCRPCVPASTHAQGWSQWLWRRREETREQPNFNSHTGGCKHMLIRDTRAWAEEMQGPAQGSSPGRSSTASRHQAIRRGAGS
jgi:hypothetical protein